MAGFDVIENGSNTVNVGDENRVRDVRADLSVLDPSATPFTQLAFHESMDIRTVTNWKYEWPEQRPFADYVKLAASYDADDTTFTLEAGATSVVRVNDILANERTHERVLVLSKSGNTITVRRGVGNAGVGVSSTNGAGLLVLANASEEGSTLPEIIAPPVTFQHNYLQTLREPFKLTRRVKESKLYSGKEKERLKRDAGLRIKRMIEKMFWVGARDAFDGPDGPQTTSGGVTDFIQTRRHDNNGLPLAEEVFDEIMDDAYQNGEGDSKILFCSPDFYANIVKWGKDRLALPKVGIYDELGLTVKNYMTNGGELVPITRVKWWDRDLRESSYLKGSGILLDMSNVSRAVMTNSDLQLQDNIGVREVDGELHGYLVDTGLEVRLEETHTWISNVARPSSS